MGKRHPNHRLVKIHRTYTVEEVAGLFGIHKNTVRSWVKCGLLLIDDKRPMLVFGKDLVEFLKHRRTKNKQTCKPGEFYCVRCRVPRPAAENIADYIATNEKTGNLVALCPACGAIINRRVSLEKIEHIRGNIEIRIPKDL